MYTELGTDRRLPTKRTSKRISSRFRLHTCPHRIRKQRPPPQQDKPGHVSDMGDFTAR